MVRGKSRRGYIPRTLPDRDRLKRKVDKIAENIKKIPHDYSKEQFINAINHINSQVRGIIQYNQCCTWVNIAMRKHSRRLQLIAKSRLKQYKGKWIPANQTQNLPRIHQQRKQKIPSIKYRDIYVGFTALTFCKWEKTSSKNQSETPYTEEGRQLRHSQTAADSCILSARKGGKYKHVSMKCTQKRQLRQSYMGNGTNSTISSLS